MLVPCFCCAALSARFSFTIILLRKRVLVGFILMFLLLWRCCECPVFLPQAAMSLLQCVIMTLVVGHTYLLIAVSVVICVSKSK